MLTYATVMAQQYTVSELKAAYLYNFSKFVEWPKSSFESRNSKFVITVLGESNVSKVLNKAFKNRTIMGHKISIRVVYDIDDIRNPHIIFVTKGHQRNLKKILDKIGERSILTVGDVIKDFCQLGGIINLTDRRSKYRFEINNKAASESGMKISSKLLVLSKIVGGD